MSMFRETAGMTAYRAMSADQKAAHPCTVEEEDAAIVKVTGVKAKRKKRKKPRKSKCGKVRTFNLATELSL